MVAQACQVNYARERPRKILPDSQGESIGRGDWGAGAHPLENLLPSNILQAPIQIPDLLRDLAQFSLVRAVDRARLPDRQIQIQLHIAMRGAPRQPASRGSPDGSEADAVVARIGGGEGELARRAAAGVDDSVVVVKGFFDRDGDGQVWVRFVVVRLDGVLECGVVTCRNRIDSHMIVSNCV